MLRRFREFSKRRNKTGKRLVLDGSILDSGFPVDDRFCGPVWRALRQLATPRARQGRVKTVGPMNDSALERVSSESIASESAVGLSGASP